MELYTKEIARDFCPTTNKAHINKYHRAILTRLAQERMLARLRLNVLPQFLLYSNRIIEGPISELHLIVHDKLSDQIEVRIPTALLNSPFSRQGPSFSIKVLTNPYVRTRMPRIINLSHKRIHISQSVRNNIKTGRQPLLKMDDSPFEFCTVKRMRAKLGSIKMMGPNLKYPLI